MKGFFFMMATFAALTGGAFLLAEGSGGKKPGEQKPEKLLRHVVLFKFKADAQKEQIRRVEEAFAALPGKIKEIHSFEMGTDVSVEDRSKGFTHAFLVSFRSKEDRDTYLPHPEHKAFVEIVGPVLEDVIVVDYWNAP